MGNSFGIKGGTVKLDENAVTFYTASGITNYAQKLAYSTWVKKIKELGLYAKHKLIFPIIGGDSGKHSYNSYNPAAFQQGFTGGIAHNADGMAGNGTTGWSDCGGFNPSTGFTAIDNAAIHCFMKETALIGALFGCNVASNEQLYWTEYSGSIYYGFNSTVNTTALPSFNMVSLVVTTGGTEAKIYLDGVYFGTCNALGAIPNAVLNIMARNNAGAQDVFSTNTIQFFSITDGMNATEVLDYYKSVKKMQSNLSR